MTIEEVVFVPLGGAGEIGMNMSLYGYGGHWLMVDMGIGFGDGTMPGVDVMTPDPAFVLDQLNRLSGLMITHAHEDHLGAIPYLWRKIRCPIYATPFASGLLRRKLEESNLIDQVDLKVIPVGGGAAIGPFVVDLIPAAHSVPEANILAIRTGAGTIVHATDWKIDPEPLVGRPTDTEALRKLGDEGVLALVCDSTNVFVDSEAGSEAALQKSLVEIIDNCAGRVAVASFASNVARMLTINKAALETGRHSTLVGRSLWRSVDIAKECGYLGDIEPFVPEREIGFIPPDRVLMGVTGSQGEPRSALARIASGSHPNVSLEAGDTVIFSSREIPGNELAIGKIQNQLARLGVNVITEKDGFVHVSGHPGRRELMNMYQWVRPKIVVPIHGEIRHLQEQKRLADKCQVPHSQVAENGTMVALSNAGTDVVGHVSTGRLAVDGRRLVPVNGAVIRERNRIRFNGSAVATVVISSQGNLMGSPQLTVLGVLDEDAEGETWCDAVEAMIDAVNDLKKSERRDDSTVQEAARIAVRRALRDSIGKRPVTNVHVVRV
ncbi:MAG: Ribonuclease J1 [Alphaproteobacteria bacterium MarineAlpha11_Bin1]|nr:MAG: Ribonuclease J1 [Alphaproteobacteria bacterium MarineAlpha11_Bin1]|tara:strand:- start:8779 stop:10428 length:1650 start_codon:yes stop_codon:yes gene_type:complete